MAVVETEILEQWALNFVDETTCLRPKPTVASLMVLDGFAGHVKYWALKVLREAGVHVVALPAQKSYRTQPLDVSVFGPMNKAFQIASASRTIATSQ